MVEFQFFAEEQLTKYSESYILCGRGGSNWCYYDAIDTHIIMR